MRWSNNHPTAAFLVVLLIGNLVAIFGYYSIPEDGGDLISLAPIALGVVFVLGSEIWYLRRKNRSLFFMFLNLLSWIGLLVLLTLANKGQPSRETNVKEEGTME